MIRLGLLDAKCQGSSKRTTCEALRTEHLRTNVAYDTQILELKRQHGLVALNCQVFTYSFHMDA